MVICIYLVSWFCCSSAGYLVLRSMHAVAFLSVLFGDMAIWVSIGGERGRLSLVASRRYIVNDNVHVRHCDRFLLFTIVLGKGTSVVTLGLCYRC